MQVACIGRIYLCNERHHVTPSTTAAPVQLGTDAYRPMHMDQYYPLSQHTVTRCIVAAMHEIKATKQ